MYIRTCMCIPTFVYTKYYIDWHHCRDMFKILSKYEVMIPEEDTTKLEGLPHAWVTFQQCLIDSDSMLKKHKVCI